MTYTDYQTNQSTEQLPKGSVQLNQSEVVLADIGNGRRSATIKFGGRSLRYVVKPESSILWVVDPETGLLCNQSVFSLGF